MNPRLAAFVLIMATNALVTSLVVLWLHAVTAGDGWIHACLDCLGEGWLELGLLLSLQLGLALVAWWLLVQPAARAT